MTLANRLEAASVTQSGRSTSPSERTRHTSLGADPRQRHSERQRAPETRVLQPDQLTVAPNARPSRYVAAAAP
jgi:hypothetical protein